MKNDNKTEYFRRFEAVIILWVYTPHPSKQNRL